MEQYSRPLWTIIFGILALVGALAACVIHIGTFFGFVEPVIGHFGMVVYLGLFVVCAPVIMLNKSLLKKPGLKGFFDTGPLVMKIVIGSMIVYCLVNMVWFMSQSGHANIIDGNYVISDHGKIFRQLTQAEYYRELGWEVRMMSGMAFVFYMTSANFCLAYQRLKF